MSAKIDKYGRQGKCNYCLAVIGCFSQTETAQLYTCCAVPFLKVSCSFFLFHHVAIKQGALHSKAMPEIICIVHWFMSKIILNQQIMILLTIALLVGSFTFLQPTSIASPLLFSVLLLQMKPSEMKVDFFVRPNRIFTRVSFAKFLLAYCLWQIPVYALENMASTSLGHLPKCPPKGCMEDNFGIYGGNALIIQQHSVDVTFA